MSKLINENRFFQSVAPFLFSESQIVAEMVENAVRAKASSIQFVKEDSKVIIKNNGQVLEDLMRLFAIADSSYDSEVMEGQNPAGMGMLSLLAICDHITVNSGTNQIDINTNLYFNSEDYRSTMESKITTCSYVEGIEFICILKEGKELSIDRSRYYYYKIGIEYFEEHLLTHCKIDAHFSKEIRPGVVVHLPTDTPKSGNPHFGMLGVIWFGKEIWLRELDPFVIEITGPQETLKAQLPDRVCLVNSKEELSTLRKEIEMLCKDEIQAAIDLEGKLTYILETVIKACNQTYSLDALTSFKGVKKDSEDEHFVIGNECKFFYNEDAGYFKNCEISSISGPVVSYENQELGLCEAPAWVKEKTLEPKVVFTLNEKLIEAHNYATNREENFYITNNITIGDIEVDHILFEDGFDSSFFATTVNRPFFDFEYKENFQWSESDCEFEDDVNETFDAVISAYRGTTTINFKDALSPLIRMIQSEYEIDSLDDLDSISINTTDSCIDFVYKDKKHQIPFVL